MLRYADAIVKRGVDKLIDAIAHSAEPQTKNAETPQPQKSMGKDTNCAPLTTGSTTNCGITLMDEQCDIRYNVLDRTPEVQRRDQADKGFVPVNKLVRNTMVIDLHKRGCMVWNNDVDRIVESAYMPQYHPFSAYLQALPQWDGTDRVGPLAERVSTDALWRMVFGRWLRCMVAGWVRATGGGTSTCGNDIAAMIKTSPTAATYSTCFCYVPIEVTRTFTISSNVKFRNPNDDQKAGLVSTTKMKAMVIDFLFDSKSVLDTKWLKNKSFALSLNKKLLPLHPVSG